MSKKTIFFVVGIFLLGLTFAGFQGVMAADLEDGQYSGQAEGFKSTIEVEVTIDDGEITNIEVIAQDETESYWEEGKRTIDDILAAQDTDVDTETGATATSNAIVEAVEGALAEARVEAPVEEPEVPEEDELHADFAVVISGAVTTEVESVYMNNRILVPSTILEEVADVEADWNLDTGMVTVTRQEMEPVELEVGSDILSVGDEEITMPVEVAAVDDTIYVPIRFVFENLDFHVGWENGTVYLTDVKEPVDEPIDEDELEEIMDPDVSFEDGTYRGVFADRENFHVMLQFTVEDNIITDIGHRHMYYDGVDYLADDLEAPYTGIRDQHKQAVEHLEGRDVRVAAADLYEPGDFVDDVDGFSGATIYSQKEASAIVDGLNRGVYRFREVGGEVPENYTPIPEDMDFEDGTYRGIFADRGEIHVNLQFTIEDNIITDIGHRDMYYDGVDYLADDLEAPYTDIRDQHKQAVEHFVGKDVREAVRGLHEPGDFVDDVDGFSGATIYSQKEASAIVDGLNRGVYRFREVGGEMPEDYTPIPEALDFEDGTYRGIFADRGGIHVNLQFTVEDNIITDIGHRHMYYDGVDYLADDLEEPYTGIRDQHKQAVEHFVGKHVNEAARGLHEPGDFVDDVDGFSGATIYSQKEASAIVDGLNRGVYRFREVEGVVPEDYSPVINSRVQQLYKLEQ